MNSIQVFNNGDFGQLRVTRGDDGEPWFVAKDVCTTLALQNNRKAMSSLDADEKGVTICDTPGGKQQMVTVSEAGLYSLVLRSRKPEAKSFKRWVTHEVLPAIHRTGGYMAATPDETPDQLMARALLVAQDTMERQRRQLDEAERRTREVTAAKIAAEAELVEVRPKALFADAVSASKTSILVGDLAKLLRQNGVDVGQNRLFQLLMSQGYLCGRKGAMWNMPTQRSMDMGLFEVKETTVVHSDGHTSINKTPKVTGKGQVYFVNRFCSGDRN